MEEFILSALFFVYSFLCVTGTRVTGTEERRREEKSGKTWKSIAVRGIGP